MMTMNGREGRKPLLSLDTAVPDPKAIEIDGELYDLRPVASYSTRERKRLQSLLTAIVEYEASDEDQVDEDDERDYKRALRSVVDIAMPSLPERVHEALGYNHYGAIASEVIKLFRERNGASDDAVPEPEETVVKPTRLRKLREKLNSPTPLRPLSGSTEGDPASG